MFTGIVDFVGRISELKENNGNMELSVEAEEDFLKELKRGESIALNGVCLTVVKLSDKGFLVDVSYETISKTTFSELRKNSRVNLERAMVLGSRINGHLVSGHVDGIAEIILRKERSKFTEFLIKAPRKLSKFISHKGSVTLDGTSLTVNGIDNAMFSITVIPYTLENTVIRNYSPGYLINIEVDLLARYIERLMIKK